MASKNQKPSYYLSQYVAGLITFEELQQLLAKIGYTLKDAYNTGRFHLFPLR